MTSTEARAAMRDLFATEVPEPLRRAPKRRRRAVADRAEVADETAPVRRARREHHHEGVRRATDKAYAKQLFALSPDVRHPCLPIQRLLPLLRPYFRVNYDETWANLQRLPGAEAMAAVLAAVCEALGTPLAFRGGNDNARGFGAGGSEWPQLGALITGEGYRSDTTLRNWFREWEENGDGYRKPRLEHEPIVCPRTGHQYQNRFGRNDVYLSRESLVRWLGNPLLRGLVAYLRDELTPTRARGRRRLSDLSDNQAQAIWIETKAGRRWRKRVFTYRDAIELTCEERKAKAARQRKAKADRLVRERRWRRAARARRDRETTAQNASSALSALAVQTLPITPPLPTGGERRAPGGASKVGAFAPAPSGPPVGRPGPTGPPRRVEAVEAPSRPVLEGCSQGGNTSRTVPDSPSDASDVALSPGAARAWIRKVLGLKS